MVEMVLVLAGVAMFCYELLCASAAARSGAEGATGAEECALRSSSAANWRILLVVATVLEG
eukprot:gene28255-31358_t